MINMTTWPTATIKVVNLLLDEENIRIDARGLSQDAIIQDLFANENAFQIVESILKNGFFSNELLVVIKEGPRYIVLEGNRRVAALKAIVNPKLTPLYESRIKKLIDEQDVTPLHEVEIKIAPSREEAQRLIASIHTIQTRKSWRPLRQAYFYYAQVESGKQTVESLRDEYPNINMPKFIRMWEMHRIAQSIQYDSIATQAAVNARDFKITNFERIYLDEGFRKKFGLSFDEFGRVQITPSIEEFKKALKKVVVDITSGTVDSRVLNSASQREKYIKSCPAPKGVGLGPIKGSGGFKPIKVSKGSVPRALIDRQITTTLGAGVERRLKELQRLPYRTYPNAAHDSLRSFLECSLKAYCDKKGVSITPQKRLGGHASLKDALEATRNHLNKLNDIKSKALAQVISRMLKDKSGFSLKSNLDATNHNQYVFTTGEAVKTDWDTISPLVEYVLKG